jgi:signal transduction histidine kinase
VPSPALADERGRLAALRRVQILDTPRERRFDDIVEIAAQVTGMPIALINLVDSDRQWGKALVGIDDSEAPRETSFCSVAIASGDEVMVVDDTHEDPRFADNPLVTGEPWMRFYAGAPIVDRAGYRLGSVCVVDRVPRTLDEGQRRALRALARQTMDQLELRLALEADREEVRSLRELDRLRDQFVATVSHELRTPLTSIRGWLDLLIEDAGTLESEERDALQRVDRNVDRLARLVGDLLDLTRADAGVLSMRSELVDLAALTRDAVASLANAEGAADRDVRLTVEPSIRVTGDTQRLARVIDNLCSNAIKYTPPGGRVAVDLGQRDGSAVLRVSDIGIGIPAAEREHLFRPFFRASTATDRGIPGTGLGLAVSKAIVERHGGSIAVSDAEGGGVVFTVTLPLGER